MCVVRRPLSWWRYKRALPRMRFHLALYPLAPTAVQQRALRQQALRARARRRGVADVAQPGAPRGGGPEAADIFVEGGADEWDSADRGLSGKA